MKSHGEELMDAKHGVDRILSKGLSAEDLTRIYSIAQNAEHPKRHKAFEIIAKLDPNNALKLLSDALGNNNESIAIRSIAATLLGQLSKESAEPILNDALDNSKDEILSLKILQSIGRVGSRFSKRSLSKFIRQKGISKNMRGLAEFALTLINHRIGEGTSKLSKDIRIIEDVSDKSLPIRLTRTDEEYSKSVRELYCSDSYGVSINESLMFSLECNSTFLLCLDQQFAGTIKQSLAYKRPLIAGIVYKRAEVDGSLSANLILLAGPNGKDKVYLNIYRLDGTQVMVGVGTRSKHSIAFELRAVERPGATPIVIDGSIEEINVVFKRALSSVERMNRQVPQELRSI